MKSINELRVPRYSHELIEKLNTLYPERCATRDQTAFDIAYYAGIRASVTTMLEWQKWDEQDAGRGE
jgi:integrase